MGNFYSPTRGRKKGEREMGEEILAGLGPDVMNRINTNDELANPS